MVTSIQPKMWTATSITQNPNILLKSFVFDTFASQLKRA